MGLTPLATPLSTPLPFSFLSYAPFSASVLKSGVGGGDKTFVPTIAKAHKHWGRDPVSE